MIVFMDKTADVCVIKDTPDWAAKERNIYFQDIDECSSNPCQNKASCIDLVAGYKCACGEGTSGKHCEFNIDECSGTPCHHGTCSDGIGSYSCNCYAGYTGNRCERETNECASNPCQHSGVCHDYVNRYVCTCKSGYTGTNCELDIDDCPSNRCQHQARCIDQLNGYKCSCTTGYTGKYCEINIECHSYPCQNGGICTDDQKSRYTCHCPLGFTGNNCEKEPSIMIKPNVYLADTKTVLEGSSLLTIPCYAEGVPTPSVTWESLDKPSLPHNAWQLGHFLVFENVSSIDGGHYVCTAKNKVGIEIKVVQVIVKARYEKPHIAPLIHAPSIIQVKYYTEAKITCNVTGFPTPNVTWIHNDFTKHTTDMPSHQLYKHDSVLTLYTINTQESGLLTCSAHNEFGENHVSVSVIVRSHLECHRNPCLNGGICTDDQASGHICHCPLGFTGQNCETEPFILVKPKIILPENKTVPDGYKTLIIPCYAEGIPVPAITWDSLDRLSIPRNARQLAHFLVFQNVSTIDAGQYMCTAKNKVGTDIKVIEVIVTAKDEKRIAPVIHAPSSVQVKYYLEGRLTCNVTGVPTPTVMWKHNSNVVQSSGNTLVIHRVTNATGGTYTCIATNVAGTSQANIQLKVTYGK
ncbi:NOTCH3 [Mytilus coruscus]|uniref:NOTCH3 n=1 Tax=Mytilus coruscus TaxID=42192 RepID=A0A6J8EYZ8_MYTCO|nr:NOTCH3 [Mytilus coruscus]